MENKPFLIVSDLHLGAVPRNTEASFRDFVRAAADRASGLLINGDLFDFWFEYRSVIPRAHFRVLAALADLVDTGMPVYFVSGNHDAWVGDFLKDEVGLRLIEGPVEMEIAGRRTLVAHGDGLGTGDLGYRVLRAVIRHKLTTRAFRMLHPDWGIRIADRVSATEGRTGAEITDAASGRANFIRAWALEKLETDPTLDMVVTGHAHVPELTEAFPNRYYVNAGDWINNFTYVEVPPGAGAPRLLRWPADSD
ncbi:MAG TPA: UDP-2,3-diacylglucosamine diphosphatase [Longimicrobiaceae bacterium]|nr:UDP-2,3-diacylglucosamine diphosphatase [Longimicrobiaceae bacterium]